MAINKAYLTCNRTKEGDEVYTPFYAVDSILEFIPKDKTIWLPFDKEWSSFNQLFKENGIKTIISYIDDGKDFFEYEPENYDIIVSNPPFSLKDKVLRRCYELSKPFALLLPVNSIQGKERVSMFSQYGLELLVFDLRVDYHTSGNFKTYTKGNSFGSAYFCKGLLPEKLIFKKLSKYERGLK